VNKRPNSGCFHPGEDAVWYGSCSSTQVPHMHQNKSNTSNYKPLHLARTPAAAGLGLVEEPINEVNSNPG